MREQKCHVPVVFNYREWVIVTALSPDGDRIGDNQSVHLVLSIAYVRVRKQAVGNKQCTDRYKTYIMLVILRSSASANLDIMPIPISCMRLQGRYYQPVTCRSQHSHSDAQFAKEIWKRLHQERQNPLKVKVFLALFFCAADRGSLQ